MGDAAFWAKKRLGDLPRYRVIPAGCGEPEAERVGLALLPNESLLGLYTNPPGVPQARIAVTSAAVATDRAGRWERMAYATLTTIRFPGGKADWDAVALVADDGTELLVSMPDDPMKPVTDLSAFLLKVCKARRQFDRPALALEAARHRDEWAARVMAGSSPAALAGTES